MGLMKPSEALKLVRDAFREDRAFLHPHCLEQMGRRGLTTTDIENAVLWARTIEPYPQGFEDVAFDEGEAWRLWGPSLQTDRRTKRRRTIGVGVYIVTGDSGEATIVVTVF